MKKTLKSTLKKLLILTLALSFAFSSILVVHAVDGTSYVSVTGYEKDDGIESVTTAETYPFAVYGTSTVLMSGNAGVSSSASVIKVTVRGSGALCFDYRVYSTTKAEENNPDSLVITVGKEITADDSYSALGGYRYYGMTDWQSQTISVVAEDEETTDIYFGFKKNGSKNASLGDCALIRNLVFNTESALITAVSSDDTLGTVTGGGTYFAGETVTLTATPQNGGRFFGWAKNGVRVEETSSTYTFTAGMDTTVTAIFGDPDATVARNRKSGAVYTDLADALSGSSSGDVVELLDDTTLTQNATVPAGVTLYVPYSETYDEDGNADGTTADSTVFATIEKTYRTLTVNSGVTLTVKGELLVGGVIGYPSQYYQGHTSGAHGRITNNGEILVDNGRIDCYGFIDGSGTVRAASGSVYEPFVVFDFSGGNNCLQLYNANQNAFTQYTVQNISCTLELSGGAVLGVYANLYASSEYNKINAILIGGENQPTAMIRYANGAKVTRTVDTSLAVSGATIPGGTYGADIKKTVYTVEGGGVLDNLRMLIYGFDIGIDQFPIPYCTDFVLEDGDYQIPKGWTIMPGASFTVAADASLTVSGKLYVLDGLVNNGMSGKYYPSSQTLHDSGFSACGNFFVNGEVTFKTNSTFGGIIQSTVTGAKVILKSGAKVENPAVQIGALAHYDDNTCVLPLNGRIKTADGIITMTPGKIYESTAATAWTLENFSVTEYASQTVSTVPTSGKYTTLPAGGYKTYAGPLTVTVNETMTGIFTLEGSSSSSQVTVANKTYYDASDATRTEVSTPVVENDTVTFTVSLTAQGAGYAFLVQVSIDGDTPFTLPPNAQGNYVINDAVGEITVTVISVKKGDVDLDGNVTAADVTKLRRSLAGYTAITDPFSTFAADCDGDSNITAADVTRLRRYLAGYLTQL